MLRPDLFIGAQAATWPIIVADLTYGQKTGHWMWFVFPQIAGLSKSEPGVLFGLDSADDALKYLTHPILGTRLVRAAELVHGLPDLDMFSKVDQLKLKSCMTLFEIVQSGSPVFQAVLNKHFKGQLDVATCNLIEKENSHA